MLLVTSVAALAYTTSKPTDTHALRPEGVWASQYSAGSIAGLNNISYYQYAVAQQTTPALMPILSSTWGNCHSLQSCDLYAARPRVIERGYPLPNLSMRTARHALAAHACVCAPLCRHARCVQIDPCKRRLCDQLSVPHGLRRCRW